MQPVKEQSTTDTDHATDHGSEGQSASGLWRSLTGVPDPANHVAPPSIMQIRISALLEEQAEALLKELRDKAIARMTAAAPEQGGEATEEPAAAGKATATEDAAPPSLPGVPGSGDRPPLPALPETALRGTAPEEAPPLPGTPEAGATGDDGPPPEEPAIAIPGRAQGGDSPWQNPARKASTTG
ncbi:hypothetical protein PVT71_01745 [Salipiger sp. H15]|uniref:Uncharacterized protein n=1 Tax=Alloyangia sp. H15 TaxID=3029062 RepID=A0AAU8AGE4_9RHOB